MSGDNKAGFELVDFFNIAEKYGIRSSKELIAFYRRMNIIGKPIVKGLGRGQGKSSIYSKEDVASFISSVLMVRNDQKNLKQVAQVREEALKWLTNNEDADQPDDVLAWIDRYLRVILNIPGEAITVICKEILIDGKAMQTFSRFMMPSSRSSGKNPDIIRIFISNQGRVFWIENEPNKN